MEAQKSNKHRSLGTESRIPSANTTRPSLGERQRSAPSVAKLHQSLAQHAPDKARLQSSAHTATELSGREAHPIINLAVLGNPRVGKTLFIRNALELENSPSTSISSKKVSLGGVLYRVQIFEIDLDDVEVGDSRQLKWPEKIGDVAVPDINAVLCLYNITDEGSVARVPQTLRALEKSNIPATLVACKADAPISEQEVGITFVQRVRRTFPTVIVGECSCKLPESAKKCLTISLKLSSANLHRRPSIREESEEDERQVKPSNLKLDTHDFGHASLMPTAPHTPVSETDPASCHGRAGSCKPKSIIPATPDSYRQGSALRPGTQDTHDDSLTGRTFLQTGEDSSDEKSDHLKKPLGKLHLSNVVHDEHSGDGGVPFSDLVDRLLQLPMSKSDAKFVPVFLCLYRAFSTPKALLIAIIDRFTSTDRCEMIQFTKVAELLRYLQVVTLWTANYPGDFADSRVRELATNFARNLEKSKSFTPAAREILGNLQTVTDDEDQIWAFDGDEAHGRHGHKRTSGSSVSKYGRLNSLDIDSDYSEEDLNSHRQSSRNSGSGSTTSSIAKSSTLSSQSATNVHSLESAREQSRKLRSIPHIKLSKVQWHHFMETPTEDLAREITRIDWTMFSATRPRDFVRHVSLSSHKRAHSLQTDTIGMMVKHFNHLALFVSGMILLRDKPKHRAQVLEKVMDLAWKVRQLNNYNSLGAIVAGVTGPEIARLVQTHELIAAETQKQFLRLTILMSIARSHTTYRLAWENSFNARIPFVPLVRQDLTMASSANQTFIGSNINWKKFEIMGDVIIGVQRSREQPYSFPERTQKSQEIVRLILETKIIDESEESADPRCELYDRSVQVEPSANSEGRKKFDWLWR